MAAWEGKIKMDFPKWLSTIFCLVENRQAILAADYKSVLCILYGEMDGEQSKRDWKIMWETAEGRVKKPVTLSAI